MKAILFILGFLLLMNLTLADVSKETDKAASQTQTTSASPSTAVKNAANLGGPSVLLLSLMVVTFHLFRLY
ncbi:hypothetical protein JRQ81_011847 [Phrynocephalus forsythii]|uniref:CAMPATH-1 antigen n=1 Tax=Phrynocephalus forsythii TaxID=171643 RepID=A0A9Q1AQY5_9SAUR|nr:hypothetical protein JRQ81_011847 [Phrynocephalus forsythii]